MVTVVHANWCAGYGALGRHLRSVCVFLRTLKQPVKFSGSSDSGGESMGNLLCNCTSILVIRFDWELGQADTVEPQRDMKSPEKIRRLS